MRRGLQAGIVAAGIATAGGLYLEERQSSPPSVPTTSTTSTAPVAHPASASDWNALGRSLTGSLVQPANPTYALGRLLYNSKFVDLHPRAIAYCATPDDVARCIDFATSHSTAIAARSGGHSYGAYSNSDGLVIDVTRMASIAVDTSANTATVGAGAKLIDVYNVLGAQNRLLPGGSCPTVGIAGLAMGGGIGVFARKYGMTSDNITGVNIVTADSTLVRADASAHADLLWACRGGGGGNFGVVTSFEFVVHPLPEVTLFTLQYPWAAAGDMMSAWGQWLGSTPDELWSNCQLLSQGSYGYLAQMAGVFCGPPNELTPILARLTSSIAAAPSYSFQGSEAYLRAMEIEAGCSGLAVAACHLTTQNPNGTLEREAYSAKSSYVSGPMNDQMILSHIHAVEHLHELAPTLGGGLAFDAYGGVINRVASDKTAFVHRDMLACIQATYSWSTYTTTSEVAAGETWLAWLGANVFDPSTGAYQNYIDPTLADWQSAYYGSNLKQLTSVKRAYDPGDLFHFAQSIPLRA